MGQISKPFRGERYALFAVASGNLKGSHVAEYQSTSCVRFGATRIDSYRLFTIFHCFFESPRACLGHSPPSITRGIVRRELYASIQAVNCFVVVMPLPVNLSAEQVRALPFRSQPRRCIEKSKSAFAIQLRQGGLARRAFFLRILIWLSWLSVRLGKH